ncbi:lipase/acyltransferase domain-containing protein [Rhizobium leguminosarum]|nr:hypothetical protein [Rhizobium leguminosarum]
MARYSDLVVLLPGITGSVLAKDGEVLWGTAARDFWRMFWEKSLDQMQLRSADNGDDDLGDGIEAIGLVSNVTIVPGLLKIDGYSNTSSYLTGNLPLTRGENYFEFPYDWRRDNRVSARRLERFCHEKLKLWRELSGNEAAKIVFIAHSMGGLVARYYIECLEGWKCVRSLITLGTPYRGSLNALDSICNGTKKKFAGFEVDGSHAFRSFQSLYQLLPTYPVIDLGDGALRRTTEVDLPFLEADRAAQARAFHSEIEEAASANVAAVANLNDRTRIVPVIGIDQPTSQSAMWAGAGPLQMLRSIGGEDDGGDQTVPQ